MLNLRGQLRVNVLLLGPVVKLFLSSLLEAGSTSPFHASWRTLITVCQYDSQLTFFAACITKNFLSLGVIWLRLFSKFRLELLALESLVCV